MEQFFKADTFIELKECFRDMFYLAWVAETLIIHTSAQIVLILRLFSSQGTVSNEEKGLIKKLYLYLLYLYFCVQVLTQLNYGRSKQVKSTNSRTATPLFLKTSHVNSQSKGARGRLKFAFILDVGKNRFLIRLEVLGKWIQTLLMQ